MNRTRFGIDVLIREPGNWLSQRIGLVTNQAAATMDGVPSRIALLEKGFRVQRLFSPEHGLMVTGADGAAQSDHTDTLTGLPVSSLYGQQLRPLPENLSDLDAMVFDIPDVGCRFYTYLWTMTHVMEACADAGIPLLVLDRPNPIGGDLDKAEGPWLDEARCASFIGRWNLPVRHSCSLGELARYFAATRVPGLQLEVIPVKNWDRDQDAETAGWPFVPTSPAIQELSTALLYPGTGLLEGVNMDEGRGTAAPFSICGAPWIHKHELSQAFNGLTLSGLTAKPVSYTPVAGPYAGETCEGLELYITDKEELRSVAAGLQLLHVIGELYPSEFRERLYPTAANPSGAGHLDKLSGLPDAFESIRQGIKPETTFVSTEWKDQINPYLLY